LLGGRNVPNIGQKNVDNCLLLQIMDGKVKILCLDKKHQGVLFNFLEEIQTYVDEITQNDDDFDIFLNVLEELIRKHNENVVFSFLDRKREEKWLKQLPNMVYWAVIGYMYLIKVDLCDLMDTIEKVNNLVNETLDKIEDMNISGPFHTIKIGLN
jgi:predicted transglutaminase-like cysteine proteinase